MIIWNIDGHNVLIDDEDYERLKQYKYYVHGGTLARCGRYYFIRNIYVKGNSTTTMLHRDIMDCVVGDGKNIDHKDGDTLNCQKENLRYSTHAENMRNRKIGKNNTSGVKGVSWYMAKGKWRVYIKVDGKQFYLGLFDDIKEAAEVYAKASKELHGEFGRLC